MFEMFNVFNHTNYTGVDAVFGKGPFPDTPITTFERYTTAAPLFQAQLGAKVWF